MHARVLSTRERFSPRNGEIILKDLNVKVECHSHESESFSPRNGEIILKGTP